MQGARWCRQSGLLQESHANMIFDKLPLIIFRPLKLEDLKGQQQLMYTCPVYKTSHRLGKLSATGGSSNFVLTINVPSDKQEAHWIKRSNPLFDLIYLFLIINLFLKGVAILCQLDD